ncbi:MAG: hypothetical protein AB1705_22290 [Verrucomicrobiota bacterium]
MKTISLTVSDEVYEELEARARCKGQSAEDLVRAAVAGMGVIRAGAPKRISALSLKPLDLGETLRPLSHDDDLLGECSMATGIDTSLLVAAEVTTQITQPRAQNSRVSRKRGSNLLSHHKSWRNSSTL